MDVPEDHGNVIYPPRQSTCIYIVKFKRDHKLEIIDYVGVDIKTHFKEESRETKQHKEKVKNIPVSKQYKQPPISPPSC
jgi:hypothetical protein